MNKSHKKVTVLELPHLALFFEVTDLLTFIQRADLFSFVFLILMITGISGCWLCKNTNSCTHVVFNS